MARLSRRRRARPNSFLMASAFLAALCLGPAEAQAQRRDSLANGAIIGAAVGAGLGIGFTHAVRDSDLTFGQYAYGALVFGAIGAGVGVGVDALLNHSSRVAVAKPRKLFIAPAAWRNVAGVAVVWRW
ncbi:MAG: hypothetical protein WBC51_01085 [Vicinamibacterales bacterium]